MTTKQSIKNNVFSLYSTNKNYKTATTELKEAADQLIKAIKKHSKLGADDTESRELILGYVSSGGKVYLEDQDYKTFKCIFN